MNGTIFTEIMSRLNGETLTWVSIVLVTLIVIAKIIKKRNLFVNLKTDVETQMSNISNYRELRHNAIKDCMDILGVAHQNDVDAIASLGIEAASQQLRFLGNKYPDLKDTPAYSAALVKIHHHSEEIAASKNILNKAIQKYNKSISMFPALIVAKMFGFERETFIDEDDMQSNKLSNKEEIDFNQYRTSKKE